MAVRNTEGDFWERVDIGQPDECWPWIGRTVRGGYGLFHFGGKLRSAHRLALMFSGVDLSEDMCSCHRCDNPICCNPFHLFVGTRGENNADRQSKGRTKVPDNRGSRHGRAKLNEDHVRAIREFVGTQEQAAIAFGVSQQTISRIRRGTHWRHM